MPPQVVAAMYVENNLCTRCERIEEVLRLELTIEGLQGTRTYTDEICSECLCREHHELSLTEQLRIKDVMELPTKARHRETKRISRRRECQAAEDIGGRTVPGSGSGEAKGDARNSSWMVEDKFTTGKSYQLRRDILSKAISQASKTGRKPVIRVGLAEGTELAISLWDDMKEVICEDDPSSEDRG
mgnify:CR=1 FL=1